MIYPTDQVFPRPLSGDYGIGIREYFAAMAMQGLLMGNPEFGTENTSRWAVKMADALILELNKPGI